MTTCSNNLKNNWEKFRYLNKNITDNERALFANYWEELVNRYGTKAEYYVYNYSTAASAHDYLYGEQPTANYIGPFIVNVLIDIPNEALLLSKFGLQTNADFTAIITIADFQNIMGENNEPKSQDVVRLVEAGWESTELPTSGEVLKQLCTMKDPDQYATINYSVTDVNFVRCPQLYEITERLWQDFGLKTTTLMGHYVWVIRGKRFDYSYQPGIIPECRQGVVSDDTRTGIATGGSQNVDFQNPQPEKPYPDNVDQDVENNIWDYNSGDTARNDNVYGKY